MDTYESLTLTCSDHYHLSARFYSAKRPTNYLPVLVCPATGVTQGFYHHFNQWLSEQGINVMVFDYRGMGESLHTPLNQSTVSKQDWGQLDIPADIETLLNKTGNQQVIIVGHSAGGQLTGIVPNYKKIAQVIAISGSTGHVKGLKGRTKRLAPILFHIIFPISFLVNGYGATRFVGMGENLPKNVARQWVEFCSKPGYVMNAVGKTIFEDYHQEIRCPITSYWASDDEIATDANVKDLLRLYPHAKTEMIQLNVQDFGHKTIGHTGMFRKSHQNLWPIMTQKIFNPKL